MNPQSLTVNAGISQFTVGGLPRSPGPVSVPAANTLTFKGAGTISLEGDEMPEMWKSGGIQQATKQTTH